ncbi:undecaprenyl-phosphate glucose phosphotransferase [Paenibacillus contaminans]|uniref:Undecaprenyl-phosphate glucose phosphotransferase n=1 Tax=Paenibacillus contaminans TaxID=450362 RepID=A0A329M9T0_9BACL|nr:undecaprenyl-phosphate glucose phosphotransferase [Paenibacillus contaminans]RAV13777.1 undecaprenyl-phosphate glucose phosphotransferase [Paenibacillus contaminans]
MIRRSQGMLTQLYAGCDFIIMQCSFLVAFYIKFMSGWMGYEWHLPRSNYLTWSLIYGVIAVGLGYLTNFYSPKRKKRFSFEVFKIIQIQAVSLLILIMILFLLKQMDVSRHFLAMFFISNLVFIGFYRYAIKLGLKSLREKGYNKQFVLILGAGSLGRRFYKNVMHHPELGFEVVGFLDDFQTAHEESPQYYKPILGKVEELESILQSMLVDEVIIALPLDAHDKYGHIISICEKAGVRTMIIPDYYDFLPARPHFDNFAGMPLINVRDIPLDDLSNRVMKRMFDIGFSLIAIAFTLPLMLIIVLGIKATSKGPIIFKQERVGLNRRTFQMYKFRSMKVLEQASSDQQWTTADDPRKTKFGSFLRKTSLDELPQFFNVLFGHMSVVGPRPERPFFVEQFKEEIPKYMVKHHIRPGITGWAQSNGLRGDTSIKDRISYDIFYIENWTFLFDIKIIWKTVWNGFVNKNAY